MLTLNIQILIISVFYFISESEQIMYRIYIFGSLSVSLRTAHYKHLVVSDKAVDPCVTSLTQPVM